jgi:hypothetical protein
MDKTKLVIGKIELGNDGVRQVVSLDHKEQMLKHQRGVQALIEAAHRFRDFEDEEALMDLMRAARNM